jgi:hypothetical protein
MTDITATGWILIGYFVIVLIVCGVIMAKGRATKADDDRI